MVILADPEMKFHLFNLSFFTYRYSQAGIHGRRTGQGKLPIGLLIVAHTALTWIMRDRPSWWSHPGLQRAGSGGCGVLTGRAVIPESGSGSRWSGHWDFSELPGTQVAAKVETSA